MPATASLVLFLLRRRRKSPWVEITSEGIKVALRGRRGIFIPLEAVALVYTTLMPKDEDFQEVLVIEYSGSSGAGVAVLDPTEGFDVPQTLEELSETLGERWHDIYIGHKHLSRVRDMH